MYEGVYEGGGTHVKRLIYVYLTSFTGNYVFKAVARELTVIPMT